MVSFEFALGLTFVVVGIVLLLIEASSPGFFIGVPATVLIVLGLIGMYVPGFFVSPWAPVVAIVVGAPLTYVAILLYQRLAPPAPPTTTVGESLIGKTGLVVREVVPDSIQGKVRIDNQVWSATSEETIPEGSRVTVVGSRGVHVVVERVETKPEEGKEKETEGGAE
jgi:membrane protein implicated in regulation of membrane protease activity